MFTEKEADAVLSLLLLKYVKYYNPNTGSLSNSGSIEKNHKAGRLLEIDSNQQTHNASNKISPSNRMLQQNKAGWLRDCINHKVIFESLINI